MRYRIIAIDLDGTLMDPRGKVSKENLAAVERAQNAGAIVVPCTGRVWRESKSILSKLPVSGPGVFVSGAAVSDIDTGGSLDIADMEPNLAEELVRYLQHLPEAVLVCRESQLCGHDYLVTGQGTLTPNTQWWFENTGSTVHFQREITTDDLRHTLRVGVVADGQCIPQLTEQIIEAFGDRVMVHCFEAVQLDDDSRCVHVLEIFAAGVDKWRGLQLIAQEHSVVPEQIAAIGDQVNDVSMIQAAGCGIAMANAVESVKGVADQMTLSCDENGVAHAIDQLLAGIWD